VETPAFMPVGTGATVKGITPAELREIGAQIVLANTYHLWLRPGRETLAALGGLHRFMAWERPILTDSGGFQVFSLESRRELDDDGVTFRSHLDGSTHRFTPENVVAFQEELGVDVAMMLDVCVKLPASPGEIEASVRRTTLWAQRGAAAWRGGATALFGIVQGGLDERLRERSARELVALDLPGYAIGGLSVGETREEMTRAGRHGRAIARAGEYNIRNAAFARDERPVDPDCSCMVCTTFTRAYLAHLFRSEELLGPRLLSYHNLAALAALTADARAAIASGEWAAFRDATLGAVPAS
jgi:queuine tRNA-ribosyltransferase